MPKKKALTIVLAAAVLCAAGVLAYLHWDDGPSNGGTSNGSSNNETAPTTPSVLTVLSLSKGTVFVMKAGTGNWTAAQVGMSLKVGDTIKTHDESGAEITFFDGSTIELEAGTQVEVVSLAISQAGSTTIKLRQAIGSTMSRVTKLVDAASTYEIETPACVAAVRGSIMLVDVIADGTTWVTNERGEIWVIANGVELQIPEGRRCIIIPGQAPKLVPIVVRPGGGGSYSTRMDIEMTKTANGTQVHDGDIITYTYRVTNPGNVALSSVSVTDDKLEGIAYHSGDTDGDGRLDRNETWIFTASHIVTSKDPDRLVNTAAAAGTYAGRTVIDWARASVQILRPAITMNKTGELLWSELEQRYISYAYTIANIGNTPLYDISVTDDMIEQVSYQSGDEDEDGSLDTNETWIFSATYWLGEKHGEVITNNATVYGTDALGKTVTAQASATVNITMIRTASIAVQVDIGPEASIRIWDETTGDWAIDQGTGYPIDGSYHTTPGIIAVVAGHCYYVWVETQQVWYDISEWPDGWEVIYYLGFLQLEVAAAYGCTAPDGLYSFSFTTEY